MKKFYGLTGTRLNIAIAVIAGIDFALFGYDQVSSADMSLSWTLLIGSGCIGWSVNASILPEILSRDRRATPSSRYNLFAGFQLPGNHCWRLYFGVLLWRSRYNMAW